MNSLAVESVGLMAPGLAGWEDSQAVLSGEQPYRAAPMPAALAALLPANERRRTTATVKLALQVGQEALTHLTPNPSSAGREALMAHTVFTSSGGDSDVLHKICTTLTEPDRAVSPTQFHHSVHNTPAGYWAIATGCTLLSLSLSAYDGSFAAGLREAAALAWTEAARVLLIAYDLPLPFPLSEQRRMVAPFAVALLLNPIATEPRLALLQFQPDRTKLADRLRDVDLERLRTGNPAARSLPLLCAMARRTAGSVTLDAGHETMLNLEVTP
ncbi:MAG: beta-ketoacyl synthase chain length factor [Gammaproteobacteria bacterium]|nr:beta-ketoacyl synthase chain length factor [Gammaproteobacteria bacterium]